MSTRSIICVKAGKEEGWVAYYHHCDGYPSWMGVELWNSIKDAIEGEDMSVENILKFSDFEECGPLDRPEDSHRYAADINFAYAIEIDQFSVKMTVYAVYMALDDAESFITPIWIGDVNDDKGAVCGSAMHRAYRDVKNIIETMEYVGDMAYIAVLSICRYVKRGG